MEIHTAEVFLIIYCTAPLKIRCERTVLYRMAHAKLQGFVRLPCC